MDKSFIVPNAKRLLVQLGSSALKLKVTNLNPASFLFHIYVQLCNNVSFKTKDQLMSTAHRLSIFVAACSSYVQSEATLTVDLLFELAEQTLCCEYK